jgi:hypothetical protein
MAHDVFICHSTKDHVVANAARARLEEANIRCWIAPRDPVPGIPYEEQIVEAIENTKLLLLIYSSASNDSRSVRCELAVAADCGKPIVPFRLESTPPARAMRFYLTSPHWLDALTPPLEVHLAELVASVPQIIQLTSGMDVLEQPILREVAQRVHAVRSMPDPLPSPQEAASEQTAEAPVVFISYASHDNEPTFPGQEGWVEMLRRFLDRRLRQLLGSDVLTFFDRSLPFADGHEALQEAVRSADAFVAIVSPSYLSSSWCMRELLQFLGNNRHDTGLYPVYKTAVNRDSLVEIPALADRVGYQFYRSDEVREFPFDPNLGEEGKREFLSMAVTLAYDIARNVRNGAR